MSDFQQTIGIVISFFVGSILVPPVFFGLQNAVPVWAVFSIIWAVIAYSWLRGFRRYRRSSFKSFESWWVADQMKSDQ